MAEGPGVPALRRTFPCYMTPMDRISSEVARLPVLDLDGNPHPLGSLWDGRAAVLVFVRHFG